MPIRLASHLWTAAIAGVISMSPNTGTAKEPDIERWVDQALNGSEANKKANIEALRALGPKGLEAILSRMTPIDLRRTTPTAEDFALPAGLVPMDGSLPGEEASIQGEMKDPQKKSLRDAIDAVAGQKYAWVSRLYWETDLEKARERARVEHKPIVVLCLLGKLTDERSCANSRFFRTLLYPDPAVNRVLKDDVILAWQSVRPVPQITIDFGDGRKVEQTITGNSIHYVLDEHGRVIDGIPGLSSPHRFIAKLNEALEVAKRGAVLEGDGFDQMLRRYHADRAQQAEQRLRELVQKLAGRSKMMQWIAMEESSLSTAEIESMLPTEFWTWAAEHEQVFFGPAARGMIAAMRPAQAPAAGQFAIPKSGGENPMLRLLASVQRSVAADTVQNDLVLHRKIHEIMGNTEATQYGIQELNNLVYDIVFLMPMNDEWLGLRPTSVFTALPNGGVSSRE